MGFVHGLRKFLMDNICTIKKKRLKILIILNYILDDAPQVQRVLSDEPKRRGRKPKSSQPSTSTTDTSQPSSTTYALRKRK